MIYCFQVLRFNCNLRRCIPAHAPSTAPLAAAVVALAPHAARGGDGPGAAALRRALHAWHPDIQAGAAIFHHNDDGGVHGGGVEALAAAGRAVQVHNVKSRVESAYGFSA